MGQYLLRVTRYPLSDDEITNLEDAGLLPDDHRERAVIEHDFVNVTADDDDAAHAAALEETSLSSKGERLSVEEVCGDGSYRPLHPDP